MMHTTAAAPGQPRCRCPVTRPPAWQATHLKVSLIQYLSLPLCLRWSTGTSMHATSSMSCSSARQPDSSDQARFHPCYISWGVIITGNGSSAWQQQCPQWCLGSLALAYRLDVGAVSLWRAVYLDEHSRGGVGGGGHLVGEGLGHLVAGQQVGGRDGWI